MLTQNQEVDNKSKKQESQENNIQLIVARSNATKPFDPAEKTLDLVPSLVKLCAQEAGHTTSYDQGFFALLLGGTTGSNPHSSARRRVATPQ